MVRESRGAGGAVSEMECFLPLTFPSRPHPHIGSVLSACPFRQPSCVFSDPGLQGTEIDIFSYKPTLLTSKTLEKIRPVLDYRCMVSGSEQKFLIGLGVSLRWLPAHLGGWEACPLSLESGQLPVTLCVLLAPRNWGFGPRKGISCNFTSFRPLS